MSNIFKNVINYLRNDNNTFSQYFGRSQLCKAGKLYERKETIFFDKTQSAASLAICLILPLLPKKRPKGSPLWNPLKYIYIYY